jgi:hypothetical protein
VGAENPVTLVGWPGGISLINNLWVPYVLAATIERIALKLLQVGGLVAMAAAFACLWLVPGATTTVLPFLLLFLCPDLCSGRREGLDQGS